MSAPRRVAAIDVGTNTVLLLIAEGDAANPTAIADLATITRLGRGVDRTARLSAEAIDRTVDCLARYATVARAHDVRDIDVVCTSATRDASNGDAFLARASEVLGVVPRIVTGDEEARLTFDGALTGTELEGDVTVFDVGGGSTELVRGTVSRDGAAILHASSLDVGTVRLTERHVRTDPPSKEELARVRADVDEALAGVPRAATTRLVGVAGTITTLAAIDRRLAVYDPAAVHGAMLSRPAIERILAELSGLSLERRQRVPGLDPARADVILAGAELVLSVLDWAGATSLVTSDRGVRWGLARTLLRG